MRRSTSGSSSRRGGAAPLALATPLVLLHPVTLATHPSPVPRPLTLAAPRWQAERLQQAREEQERAAEMQHEEQERKEREREELRHRAAQKAAMSGDQWWLSYQNKGGGKQREKAKWQARLKRFLQIVESSTADGERENAQRLAEQAQAKLDSLEEQQDDDE